MGRVVEAGGEESDDEVIRARGGNHGEEKEAIYQMHCNVRLLLKYSMLNVRK